MSKKKILILKNDRAGDLFTSLKTINKILNKHHSDKVAIILSKLNYKFHFIFDRITYSIFNLNLSLVEKVKILFYFIKNDVDTAYILTPKNFYYYLPLLFRKTKFYGIIIKAKRSRPSNFLKKFLHKYVIIDRIDIKKRNSTYNIQEKLIDFDNNKNFLNLNSKKNFNFNLPNNYIFFHYKHSLFKKLLNWDLNNIDSFLKFLKKKHKNILFTSEIKNESISNYFINKYYTYDFATNKSKILDNNGIIFLNELDGESLFHVIKNSEKVICPEGIMTHIAYFCKVKTLALLHFNLKNNDDFRSQIISCKEWFPPDNFEYCVLKKNFNHSLKKLEKRI